MSINAPNVKVVERVKAPTVLLSLVGALLGLCLIFIFGQLPHKEAGLMKVCWESHQARYAGCQGATEDLVWPQRFPLTYAVLLVHGTDAQAAHSDIDSAARDWNHQIGFEAFVHTENLPSADVFILYGTYIDPKAREAGSAKHARGGRGTHAFVEVMTPATRHLGYLVTFHELGHALGLAHDDYPDSSMYAEIVGDGATRVSDADRELLRSLYRK